MPVIIDNQECIIQCISKINQKLKNIHFVNDLIDKITEISFKNYIGRISFGSDQSFHTIYSINPEFQTQYKCLWYYSAKDTIHYLGLYTPNKNKDTFTRDDETSPPSSPKTLTIPNERKYIDPKGATFGYEDFQYIDEKTKIILNRDHIIPFDKIMTFVNVLLDLEDFKYNEWFKKALETYNLKRNEETQEFYKRAIENEVVKNKALNYQSIFLEKKIIQETDDDNKKAGTIVKWFYEPYIIVKKIETENKDKKKSEIEQIIKELEKIRPDTLAAAIRSESKDNHTDHPRTISPSAFFTDNDGKYIDVDSVLNRFDKQELQISDEFIIKKATGWMPGNIFRAPKPKFGDESNKFDRTVAASVIRQGLSSFSEFLKNYSEAYNKINEFLNNNNFNAANIAIEKLADIAHHPNFRPFIYTNWLYYNNIFYPIKIFDLNKDCITDNIIKDNKIENDKIFKENALTEAQLRDPKFKLKK